MAIRSVPLPAPSGLWYDLLFPDVRALIRVELDEVSALALALCCREEMGHFRLQASRCGSLLTMLLNHHDLLALHCYPRTIARTDTDYFAELGALHCFMHAVSHGMPMKTWIMELATKGGHLHILRYAFENGAAWDATLTSLAAGVGHLECLVYLHEQGVPWSSGVTTQAAANGNYACMVYAHEHGCPWDFDTTEYAARMGHLQCLIYAHEHGCLWSRYVLEGAISHQQKECALYAFRHGAHGPISHSDMERLQEWTES